MAKLCRGRRSRLWGRDELSARTERVKANPENQFPPLPTQGREQMEGMLRDAVGDVVYGVAVAPRTFLVRTGTELICIRRRDEPGIIRCERVRSDVWISRAFT